MRLQAAVPPHPRLFCNDQALADVQARIGQDPMLAKLVDVFRKRADAMLAEPPVERVLIGKRMLDASRASLTRLINLSLMWRITRDRRYLERGQQEMLAAAAFQDWNPSHFLDTAEMSTALAVGYDWMHSDLAPEVRLAIRQALVAKGLKPFRRNRMLNNWNQVCNGGMAITAMALLDDEPELARRIINQAVTDLPLSGKSYDPDGAYPEGPTYWIYGTGYQVLLIAALESVFGTDAGLTTPAFVASARYEAEMIGPTGLYFNYSDSTPEPKLSPFSAWLVKRGQDPVVTWSLQQRVAALIDQPDASMNRFLPLLLIWWQRQADRLAAPTACAFAARGETPVATHRTGWDRDATYVAIKAGSPESPHAHMDVGSFVIDAGGRRWAEDLGKQDYYSLESQGILLADRSQTGQRWDVFRLGPASHNVLMVDGQRQVVSGHATISAHSPTATVVDLGPVYAGQLAAARRGIRILGERAVLIQDELRAPAERAVQVRWAMLTGAEIVDSRQDRILLRREGVEMALRVLSPSGATLRSWSTDPPRSTDAPNPGTRLVGCEVGVPAGAVRTVAVLLTPADAEMPRLDPLAAW